MKLQLALTLIWRGRGDERRGEERRDSGNPLSAVAMEIPSAMMNQICQGKHRQLLVHNSSFQRQQQGPKYYKEGKIRREEHSIRERRGVSSQAASQ